MNSFNHYAYGSVLDWVYSVAAGIDTDEKDAGYKKVIIAPNPDRRLGLLSAELKTRSGIIKSEWMYENDKIHYHIVTPVETVIKIGKETMIVPSGEYDFVK